MGSWSRANAFGRLRDLSAHPNRSATPTLYAWSEGQAEIEFLLESGPGQIPVEVKSGQRIRAKSMRSYIERWRPTTSIVISAREYSESTSGGHRQIALPLYLTARVWSEVQNQSN